MSDDEARSPDQIRQHYLIEKELATRLRTATREERRHLYTAVYDELFRRVPDHPQLVLKRDGNLRRRTIAERLELLKSYLKPNFTYLELGPGAGRRPGEFISGLPRPLSS